MNDLCEVCGNELPTGRRTCPYCGARCKEDSATAPAGEMHRLVNIELGRPVVARALERLEGELARARLDGVAVLTIIHGYGASGRGGAIRRECRKMLDFYRERGVIREYIAGENFLSRHGPTKALLRRLPRLAGNSNLNRRNRGITIVEM